MKIFSLPAALPGVCQGLRVLPAAFAVCLAGAAAGGDSPSWVLRGGFPWVETPDFPGSGVVFPVPKRPRADYWLETVITGPCSFVDGPELLLADRGLRRARDRVTEPGPHRVILFPESH